MRPFHVWHKLTGATTRLIRCVEEVDRAATVRERFLNPGPYLLPLGLRALKRAARCRKGSKALVTSLVTGFMICTASVQAQSGAAASKEASRKSLPGPKLLNLRYDEDFSYLEGQPGTYRKDFFDPIKNIRLDEKWRLSLGGEFRYRLEAETNKAFGATEPAQDTFHLFRYLIHFDLKYGYQFRVFVQAVSTFDEERDLALRAVDENRWDLHQLFFDALLLGKQHPWMVRVGRQELQYGRQRFVSPLDWANVRRRFDGVKLFSKGLRWNVDLWFVKPVVVQRKQRDRFNEDVDFYGLYTTYKGIPRHGIDFFFFAIEDRGNRVNPNGNAGDRSIFTLGSRFWGRTAGFDYEGVLAGQWGSWAGDTVQAWSWTVNAGYTLARVAWKPRLGVGFDLATGDDNPNDRKVGTFDQLFPLGHAFFGFLDLVGRQNIVAVNVNWSAWPIPRKVKAAMTFHAFWLNAEEDALYNAGGRPGRRDSLGASGKEVGKELDVTLVWKLDTHASLLLGYSHFWESDFIQQTGVSEDADLFYIQYAYKF